jgi:hypothetical protein
MWRNLISEESVGLRRSRAKQGLSETGLCRFCWSIVGLWAKKAVKYGPLSTFAADSSQVRQTSLGPWSQALSDGDAHAKPGRIKHSCRLKVLKKALRNSFCRQDFCVVHKRSNRPLFFHRMGRNMKIQRDFRIGESVSKLSNGIHAGKA